MDVAELAGLSAEHVARLEAGLHAPSWLTVRALAKALDAEPAAIFPTTSEGPAGNGPLAKTREQTSHGRAY